MTKYLNSLEPSGSASRQILSRRGVLVTGLAIGTAGVVSCSKVIANNAEASVSPIVVAQDNVKGDIAILNGAIDLENQGIWAYGAAGGKLTNNVDWVALAIHDRL